jgi:C-terminal processing protease CtpA/Prc
MEIYSAPEGVAKVLQRMRHAVIVGEPTRGATNVTAGFAIDEHFSVSVPYTRSVDENGKDLTRTGVEPDIPIAATKALQRAQLEALRRLKGRSPDAEIEAERVQTIAALEKGLSESINGLRRVVIGRNT